MDHLDSRWLAHFDKIVEDSGGHCFVGDTLVTLGLKVTREASQFDTQLHWGP